MGSPETRNQPPKRTYLSRTRLWSNLSRGNPMSVLAAVLYALALYAVAGVVTAIAFVSVGVSQVQPMPATIGAFRCPPAASGAKQMSVGLRAVQWNRDKLVYDGILLAAVALYLAGFVIIGWRMDPPKALPDVIDQWIRATGTCAFLMLTVILSIGPLARLDRRFLRLLYNRRHFGVLTFLVASTHVALMLDWYWVQNALPNLATELTKWADYGRFIGFPFKVLGIGALLIMFLLASTSHDFWLVFLTPRVWKFLHMALYLAYG